MHPLETYLQDLRGTRASGAAVKETSYYPALANLLNEVGKKLKPKVRCIIHPQDTGAGLPDGGLFTEEQIRNNISDLLSGAVPARGAIEAKPTNADAWKIAESKQVKEYWTRYRQVLVTNYRDFLLLGADADGIRTVLETYRLARDEQDFWRKAAHPRAVADQQGESFDEFLKRVMLYQASLATPRDLAWFLASYAREAKFRVESGELPALSGIRSGLEEALGPEIRRRQEVAQLPREGTPGPIPNRRRSPVRHRNGAAHHCDTTARAGAQREPFRGQAGDL